MMNSQIVLNCFCDEPDPVPGFQYDRPPQGETPFPWKGTAYRRGYQRCRRCGHWSAEIRMDLTDFYRGGYMDGTYGDRIRENFQRVLSLPAEKSDNTARVQRVLTFAKTHLAPGLAPKLLDVGSGLAVFPFRMREFGWQVTALDPDARAAEHARRYAGVRAIHADFMEWEPVSRELFDVITFNKVLEHVEDPVAMLVRARRWISPQGFLYAEVPDVSAAAGGPAREEFCIEHLHVFSLASLTQASRRAGWSWLEGFEFREPSSKYTLCAFLRTP